MRKQLVAVVLVTLVVRVAVVWALRDQLTDDPDAYMQIAGNVRSHGVYGLSTGTGPRPTAFRPPLYPLLLSLMVSDNVVSLTVLAAVHVLMGLATALIVFLLARRLTAKWAWIPAVLVACDPILLHQSSLVMTETTAALLATLSLWLLVRYSETPSIGRAIVAAASMSVAVLCRPPFLVWQVLALALLFTGWHRSQRGAGHPCLGRRVRHSLAFVVTTVVVLAPWTVRNAMVMGKPIFATSHGGYTLLLGNNRMFYDHLSKVAWNETWDSLEFDRGTRLFSYSDDPTTDFWSEDVVEGIPIVRSEAETDQFTYRVAMAHIRENPRMFAYSCTVRMRRFWKLVPHQLDANESSPRRMIRYAIGVWYGILFVLCLWRFLCLATWRQPVFRWGALLVLALTVVHTVFWSNMRMRGPIMPVLCLLVVAGLRSKDSTSHSDDA